MKILFTTNIPSPYRIDFFNELGKYCDLTVVFEKSSSMKRDNSWTNFQCNYFNAIFLKGIQTRDDAAFSPAIIKYVSDPSYTHIICGNYATPTGITAILFMKLKKIKYWYEGDGGFAKNGKGLKEKFKKFLLSGAKGYFSPSKEHDKFCITYGASPNKIFRYPFTSLFTKEILQEPLTQKQKVILRENLGISTGHIILGVGSFIEKKGFDILLHALSKLPKSTNLYLVGGKITTEYEKLIKRLTLKNIYCIDFKSKSDLKLYYQAADIFVLPTRNDVWGLVINEAMANGLPVITTDKCGAGLELVKDGKTGYIIPVNDVNLLAKKINKLLSEPALREEMACEVLKTIRSYTFENMVNAHLAPLDKK